MTLLLLRHVAIITQTILMEHPETCFSCDLQVVLCWDCNEHKDNVSTTRSSTSQFAKVYTLARFLTLCSGDFTSYRDTLALLRYITWCSHISGVASCIDPSCLEAETALQNNCRKKHHSLLDVKQDPGCEEQRKCFRPKHIVSYSPVEGRREGHAAAFKFNLTSLHENDLSKYADWVRTAVRIAFHTSNPRFAQQYRPSNEEVELSAEPRRVEEIDDANAQVEQDDDDEEPISVADKNLARRRRMKKSNTTSSSSGTRTNVDRRYGQHLNLVSRICTNEPSHQPQDWSSVQPGTEEHVQLGRKIAAGLRLHRFKTTQGLYIRSTKYFICFDCPYHPGWEAVRGFINHLDNAHHVCMKRCQDLFRPIVCDWCGSGFVSTASLAFHFEACPAREDVHKEDQQE